MRVCICVCVTLSVFCVFCVFVCFLCICACLRLRVCVCVFMYIFVHMVKNPPASARATGDAGSIPGSGRSPGEWNGNPLHCSCLANPMDRGALVGCGPCGHEESDMMEQWSTCLCICLHVCLFVLYASGCVCVCARMCVYPLGDHQNQGWWSNVVTPQCAHSLSWGRGGG